MGRVHRPAKGGSCELGMSLLPAGATGPAPGCRPAAAEPLPEPAAARARAAAAAARGRARHGSCGAWAGAPPVAASRHERCTAVCANHSEAQHCPQHVVTRPNVQAALGFMCRVGFIPYPDARGVAQARRGRHERRARHHAADAAGAFVTRVGRHPGQAALATYLARLREQARRGRCSIAILRAWHRLEHQSNLLCQ